MGFRKVISVFLLLLFFGCEHLKKSPSSQMNGVQQAYAGFVPARIAVLGCMHWPLMQVPTSISKDLAETCKEVDAFVIKNFSNQPYMHGYSPSLVKKLLQTQPGLIEQLPALWQKATASVSKDFVSVYNESIAESDAWKFWLHQVSVGANYSDAVLLPFVFDLEESCAPERGLMASVRSLHIGLFLIDTQKGQNIWWEEKKATLSNKQWLYDKQPACPVYPDWTLIKERVLVPLLWKDFPGRLTLSND